MRKLIARVCALALVVTSLIAGVSVPDNVQAADTKNLKINYVKDANEIDDLDWIITKDWDPSEKITDSYKMEIKTDTYLYVSASTTCDISYHNKPNVTINIYSNKAKTSLFDSIKPSKYSGYVTLIPKGIYYVDIEYYHLNWSYDHKDDDVVYANVQLAGLKVKDALTFSTKENRDGSVYVTTTNHGRTIQESFSHEPYFFIKKISAGWHYAEIKDTTSVVCYKDEGIYHYYLTNVPGGFTPGHTTPDYDFKYIIDKTSPKVSGVKNGKTYKNSVKFKFSDKLSGIKSATLDGEEIENHWMCDEKGKHVLKVWDKSGNKTVVKFTIK